MQTAGHRVSGILLNSALQEWAGRIMLFIISDRLLMIVGCIAILAAMHTGVIRADINAVRT